MDDSKLVVDLNDPNDIQRAITTLGEVMLGHVRRLEQGLPLPAPTPTEELFDWEDFRRYAVSTNRKRLATYVYHVFINHRDRFGYPDTTLSAVRGFVQHPIELPNFGMGSLNLVRDYVKYLETRGGA